MAFLVGEDRKAKAGSMDMLASPGSFENIRKAQMSAVQPDPNVRKYQAPDAKEKTKPKYADGDIVEDEEAAEDEAAATQLTGGISGSSAGPAAPTSAGGATSAGGTKQAGFANVQQYLEANKPKVEQISQDITSGIQKEAEGLKSSLGASREQYLGQEGTYGAGSKDFLGQQLDRAGSGTSTDEQKERFGSLRTGADAGPSFDEQRQKASSLESRAKGLGTEAGRFSEVERAVGKQAPRYTAGQKNLDQLLFGADKGYAKAIGGVRESTAGLGSRVGQLGSDISTARGELKSQAQTGLDAARATERDARQARQERLQSLSVGGKVSDEDLAAMGLNRDQVANLYGVDVGQSIGSGGVTQERLDRMNALAQLGGQQGSPFSQQTVYDPTALLGKIDAAKGSYESQFNPALQRQQQLEAQIAAGQAGMTNLPSVDGTGVITPESSAQIQQALQGLGYDADTYTKNDGSLSGIDYERARIRDDAGQSIWDDKRGTFNQESYDKALGLRQSELANKRAAIEALQNKYKYGQGLT